MSILPQDIKIKVIYSKAYKVIFVIKLGTLFSNYCKYNKFSFELQKQTQIYYFFIIY